jgi:hypothetical protein
MLPGLRFLFVAVVLSVSMLIFGLGAAALLRSAHEEFANLPTRRAQPDTVFAQQTEANRPMLGILRVDPPVTPVDPPVAEHNGSNRPADPDVPNAAPPQGQTSPVTAAEPDRAAAEPDRAPPEPDRQAALTPAAPSEEKSGSANKSASSDKSPEPPAQIETTARIEMPAPPPEGNAPEAPKPETQPAVIPEATSSAAVGATAPASEPAAAPTAAAPTSDGANAASRKIATLGGPAVTTEAQKASKTAVTPPAKRVQARRVIKRRRMARARVAAPPPKPAAPVGPFGTQPGT